MKTPTKYTLDYLQKVLTAHGNPSIYHCTRLANLQSILSRGSLYSVGTLWGLDHGIRQNAGFNGAKTKYDIAAEQGFIDYIYFSPFNRVTSGSNFNPIYGHISFEFDSSIMFNREHFFFPFNSGFNWNYRADNLKYSDLHTLSAIFKNPDPNQEILLRRAVPLTKKLKKIHAFKKDQDKVLELTGKFKEDIGSITPVFHDEGVSMDQSLVKIDNVKFATIHGKQYDGTFIFQVKDKNEEIYLLDQETNCMVKFSKIGDQLFYEEDKVNPVGSITKKS